MRLWVSFLRGCVQVISAHNLPKPQGAGAKGEVIDPYVVLELHGVPADCAEQRTRTAAQNQDDPLFDETFEFQVLGGVPPSSSTARCMRVCMCVCVCVSVRKISLTIRWICLRTRQGPGSVLGRLS